MSKKKNKGAMPPQQPTPGTGPTRDMDDAYYDSSATKNKPGLNTPSKTKKR